MATKFTWNIESMLCEQQFNGYNNVVTMVFYRCTGDNGDNQISLDGICQIPFKAGNFTSFDQLTKEQVWKWLDDQKIDRASMEKSIQTELDKKKVIPPVMMSPPWEKSS